MLTALIVFFVLGYLAITLEHTLKVDKLIPALIMMAILWTIVAVGHMEVFEVNTVLKELEPAHLEGVLLHHLGKTAEILVFLIGAMTIVEIIDYFDGFASIKRFINTKSKSKLLWIMGFLAFILSAIIDNLTATIVLITILRKLVEDRNVRLWYAGMIVIAANAGGAWSPIGDVTTTMLWIGKKVTTVKLITYLMIPSLLCMVVPFFIASRLTPFRGNMDLPKDTNTGNKYSLPMLILGLGMIVFVPIFKTITHLPPYVGMMLSLAIVATFAEIFSLRHFSMTTLQNDDNHSHHSPIHGALTRIELPSILFFLGILMAVAALESVGQLFHFAEGLTHAIPNLDIVVIILGAASAVIDNVPLVAASMGMFSQPVDDFLWHFIAYSAGTGGSMLIIGSAAGVVAMGMEKIDFFWYMRKVSWLALIGFLVGAVAFILLKMFVF
ncbi:MAG: sodium:proton antiporter [Bacteroidetes bacterium]|nr:sodium:proton antiporter [Bacteroidota bacterium]